MYSYEAKTSYSFSIYPAVLIPSDFTACTVMSILDYDTAQSMSDVAAKHVQVYPYLPGTVSNDPKSYLYLKIKLKDGTTTIIGAAWVREDTIVKVVGSTATITVSNIAASDVDKLAAALSSNGFKDFSIVVK